VDFPSSDLLSIIYHLLPGFVAAWAFYGLTAHRKAEPFERVVHALIFTAIARAFVVSTNAAILWSSQFARLGCLSSTAIQSHEAEFVWSVIAAVLLGVTAAALANTNKLHAALPDWITKRTSYPSEWFSAFQRTQSFVYLHFKDGRRIWGWPEEWPDHPDVGYFVLMRPEWVLDDNQRVPLVITERMLIPASCVEFVEFEKDLSKFDESMRSSLDDAEKRVVGFNQDSVPDVKDESE